MLETLLQLAVQYWPATILIVMITMFYTLMNTWTQYLAVMALKEKRDALIVEGKSFTKPQKIFGYPLLIRGLIWDVFLNFFVGTICFLELPRYDKKEWLFTGRVSRWNDTGGWRGDLARWFCHHFLDPFEKGGHCS